MRSARQLEGGKIDLKYIKGAAEEIGAAMQDKVGRTTVVVKSTVIPGTTVGVVRDALEEASGKIAGKDFGLGMNPEFLTEGTAVADFAVSRSPRAWRHRPPHPRRPARRLRDIR